MRTLDLVAKRKPFDCWGWLPDIGGGLGGMFKTILKYLVLGLAVFLLIYILVGTILFCCKRLAVRATSLGLPDMAAPVKSQMVTIPMKETPPWSALPFHESEIPCSNPAYHCSDTEPSVAEDDLSIRRYSDFLERYPEYYFPVEFPMEYPLDTEPPPLDNPPGSGYIPPFAEEPNLLFRSFDYPVKG